MDYLWPPAQQTYLFKELYIFEKTYVFSKAPYHGVDIVYIDTMIRSF